MTRLFSYVVEHDYGFAPNPFGGYCTLAKCKYGSGRYRNIVELAEVGDWIVGTGGARESVSAGHGKLVYAMRVDEKLRLADYYRDKRFGGRPDAKHDELTMKGHFALVSRHFFYFGGNAIDMPTRFLNYPLEKKGPGFRYKDFAQDFINDFTGWLEATFKVGLHGSPCGSDPELRLPTCAYKVKKR